MELQILNKNFYERDTITVAKELLGKYLVHKVKDKIVGGKIVEVEAYTGINDKAAHVYGGKKTPRVMPMYGDAGNTYIYSIYGKYVCLNIITVKKGEPQGVLIRAIEPLFSLDSMAQFRYNKFFNSLTKKEILNLTSGPSKLCMALNITKEQNDKLLGENDLYILDNCKNTKDMIERNEEKEGLIVSSKRIGIDYAMEARDYLYRFYFKDNPYVSIKDKN